MESAPGVAREEPADDPAAAFAFLGGDPPGHVLQHDSHAGAREVLQSGAPVVQAAQNPVAGPLIPPEHLAVDERVRGVDERGGQRHHDLT